MKFIYATDIHGNEQKYNDILSFAIENKIKLIHLGSDILPKGSCLLEIQKRFINGFLKSYFEKCKENEIKVLCFFGNDDAYTRKKYFKKFGSLLDEVIYTEEDYVFKAYPYVCDYPFPLKTACKLDFKGWERPHVEYGVDSDDKLGIIRIQDLDRYFYEKTTIEEDLKKIKIIPNKTIFACHMPPYSVDLDVCGRRNLNGTYDQLRRVGSRSIYEWIKKEQPLLTLCGHIHESYDITNCWKVKIGKTLVIQPGQPLFETRFILIDIQEKIVCELITV